MTPNGLDLYHGDNRELLPDFAALKNQGIQFVWLKATQGGGYKDPSFPQRCDAALAAGLLVGAYHFLTNSQVTTQADNFFGAIDKRPVQMACDYERSGVTTPFAATALQFMTYTNCKWIYGSDLVRELPTGIRGDFTSYNLWLAEYGPQEILPPPWTDPNKTIWQFSGSGSVKGITGHVDLNYCPGNIVQLWES